MTKAEKTFPERRNCLKNEPRPHTCPGIKLCKSFELGSLWPKLIQTRKFILLHELLVSASGTWGVVCVGIVKNLQGLQYVLALSCASDHYPCWSAWLIVLTWCNYFHDDLPRSQRLGTRNKDRAHGCLACTSCLLLSPLGGEGKKIYIQKCQDCERETAPPQKTHALFALTRPSCTQQQVEVSLTAVNQTMSLGEEFSQKSNLACVLVL